jgi:hypothetical protein
MPPPTDRRATSPKGLKCPIPTAPIGASQSILVRGQSMARDRNFSVNSYDSPARAKARGKRHKPFAVKKKTRLGCKVRAFLAWPMPTMRKKRAGEPLPTS